MITAERLEELIKQGATIYHILFNGFDLVDLTKIKELDRNNHFEYYNDCFSQYVRANNKDLYETQEQAEWYCKMTAERIERFEPPLWDDIDTQYEFNFFDRQFIRPGIYSVRHMRLSAYNGDKDKEVYLYDETNKEYEIYEQHATKEDYEKACENVRDLFNKEKK